MKIFWFCAVTALSSYDCFKGKKKVIFYPDLFVIKRAVVLRMAMSSLFYSINIFIMKHAVGDNMYV